MPISPGMRNCPACNTEVSAKAEKCPKCGHPLKFFTPVWILGSVLGLRCKSNPESLRLLVSWGAVCFGRGRVFDLIVKVLHHSKDYVVKIEVFLARHDHILTMGNIISCVEEFFVDEVILCGEARVVEAQNADDLMEHIGIEVAFGSYPISPFDRTMRA